MGRDERKVSDGRRGHRMLARLALAVLLLASTAAAAPDPKAETKGKKAAPVDLAPALDQIAETQRAADAALSQLREQLAETQRTIAALRDESREKAEAAKTHADQILDQVEGMRKEVWGLYVENSGLKGDIAQTGKQVEGLDESLGSFRQSAGIIVAVVVVLQLFLVGLTFRGRG